MLRELRIENIAVIERADIFFSDGLNVLTGETGAGKSIVIDALSTVSGARVSKDLVRQGTEYAGVTAVFDRGAAGPWLQQNEVDTEEDELILQRRVSAEGKSSCRINGYPVTAAQLRELASFLLEIHGQNDGLQLLDEKQHLSAIDRYAGLNLSGYREAYCNLRSLQKELEQRSMDEMEKEQLRDRLTDTVSELEAANIRDGEYAELQQRRDLLRNSEKLTEALQEALNVLNRDDGAISATQEAAKLCQKAAGYATELTEAADQLSDAGFQLSDAEEKIRDFLELLNYSPEEYDRLEQRLRELSRLERKYRRQVDELPDYLTACRQRLEDLQFSEERIRKLEEEVIRQETACRKIATEIGQKRRACIRKLSDELEQELHELSMPAAQFEIEMIHLEELTPDGTDTARFLLSANRGEAPGRLSRIASGGELSRIMLALKKVFSSGDPVQTMVFDEIDTGVSGIAAQRVGEKLAKLSREKQILCVTHLPQLASLADRHFRITKTEDGNRTSTEVSQLDQRGRCEELARLHGGDNITETTLRSAEEQLQYAEDYKKELQDGSI